MTDKILQFASPRQKEYYNAVQQHGSKYKAAEALGVNIRSLHRSLKRLENNAAKRGYSPKHDMTNSVPQGYHVKGVSTLYKDGDAVMQWVKSGSDNEQRTLEALRESVEDILSEVRGKYKPVNAPSVCNADLLCVYPIADAHIGLYADAAESGQDSTTDSAIETIIAAMTALVDQAPKAETAVIFNLADFIHADTSQNMTLGSGHILDVSTRWTRTFQKAATCYRKLIELALLKHKKVIVKAVKGNHDEHSIFALTMLQQAYFESDKRVEIELPFNPFAYHEFGANLLGINHGDKTKADKLPMIMASDKGEAWGRTKFHYWWTGHIHHKTVHEFPGCVVESLRSPAAKDQYSNRGGYRSERDLQQITYHIDHGEKSRQRIAIF